MAKKEEKKCNCDENCTCGCQEGKECTCKDEKCKCVTKKHFLHRLFDG